MKRIAVVFSSAPHATSKGREGLDALLALSAYHDDLCVFFVDEGVLHLVKDQQPERILCRDYISALKLLELYDINTCYACQTSCQEWGLNEQQLVIPAEFIAPQTIGQLWQTMDHILHF